MWRWMSRGRSSPLHAAWSLVGSVILPRLRHGRCCKPSHTPYQGPHIGSIAYRWSRGCTQAPPGPPPRRARSRESLGSFMRLRMTPLPLRSCGSPAIARTRRLGRRYSAMGLRLRAPTWRQIGWPTSTRVLPPLARGSPPVSALLLTTRERSRRLWHDGLGLRPTWPPMARAERRATLLLLGLDMRDTPALPELPARLTPRGPANPARPPWGDMSSLRSAIVRRVPSVDARPLNTVLSPGRAAQVPPPPSGLNVLSLMPKATLPTAAGTPDTSPGTLSGVAAAGRTPAASPGVCAKHALALRRQVPTQEGGRGSSGV